MLFSLNKKYYFFLALFPLLFLSVYFARAENSEISIFIDKKTIVKGYEAKVFAGAVKVALLPQALKEEARLKIKIIDEPLPEPWRLERLSPIFQFEINENSAYDGKTPLALEIKYKEGDNGYKQIYFFDKNYNSWRPLPSKDIFEKKTVRSSIRLPFARLAVFSDSDILTVGRASWYAYKGGDFTASPDFPKGSVLRVHNLDNGKFVDVKVNDWGPERDKFPDRVVDLDKKAFAKIASPSAGTARVRVEPLLIVPDERGNILSDRPSGAASEPEISAAAAFLLADKSGKLFAKNADKILPIASLTKLAAIKTFLESEIPLDKEVAYSQKDEEFNNEYVDWPGQSSRLKLEDGDRLTVKDLVYSSLVGSTNNTIETLARINGSSRADFIEKMNANARAWGASSTLFVEPSGLSPENKSTAEDYAIIAEEVLSDPLISAASRTKVYKSETLRDSVPFRRTNTNALLYSMDFNIIGGKTGYLDEAGYCLVLKIKAPQGEVLTGVILGAKSRADSFYEMKELLEFGLKKIEKND